MPRRLSDIEWVRFQNDVNVEALGLPPWGGVVDWQGVFVLVYICPGKDSWLCNYFGYGCTPRGTLCQAGEVMLTDVSDRRDLIRNTPGTYDVNSGNWTYHVTEETMKRLLEVGATTLQTTGTIIQGVAETAGAAAGALTKPLASNLTIPLALAAVVLILLYKPR